MYSVWFYAPITGERRFLSRYHSRNEAEAYKQNFQRLIGAINNYTVTVCFDD